MRSSDGEIQYHVVYEMFSSRDEIVSTRALRLTQLNDLYIHR